jgi:osmoprotectant transport system ATP-binding protein
VGAGAALKQLTLTRVRDVELHEAAVARIGGDLAAAIAAARVIGSEYVLVLDDQNRPQRWMSLQELGVPGSLKRVARDEDLETVDLASTLNDALDGMLTSSHGVVVVTGNRNVFQGVIQVETIMDAMAEMRGTANASGRTS